MSDTLGQQDDLLNLEQHFQLGPEEAASDKRQFQFTPFIPIWGRIFNPCAEQWQQAVARQHSSLSRSLPLTYGLRPDWALAGRVVSFDCECPSRQRCFGQGGGTKGQTGTRLNDSSLLGVSFHLARTTASTLTSKLSPSLHLNPPSFCQIYLNSHTSTSTHTHTPAHSASWLAS